MASHATMRTPPARFSDIWTAPLHDFPIRDEILYQFLSFSPDMDVLEIGPGSGYTAFRLSRLVRHLTLLDVAADALSSLSKQLQPLPNVNCVCADVTRRGLVCQLKRHFDVAFGLDMFEYLADPAAALCNLAEVLRLDGELFLTYPNEAPPRGDGVTYFGRSAELETLLKRANFGRWQIFAVRQRPYAAAIYEVFHEWPMQLYRRLRKGNRSARPQTYEATWAFRYRRQLQRYRTPLHLYWGLLEQAMRMGGDAFAVEPVTDGILGQQMVIRAWR